MNAIKPISWLDKLKEQERPYKHKPQCPECDRATFINGQGHVEGTFPVHYHWQCWGCGRRFVSRYLTDEERAEGMRTAYKEAFPCV